jgi:uncharacterized protein (TIGR04222 family)
MTDMLIQIPGPVFLKIFMGFSGLCIILAWLQARDTTTRYRIPEPTDLNAMEIAALRGGKNAAIRTALFALWNREMLRFEGEAKSTRIRSIPSQQPRENEIEEAVYQFAQFPRHPDNLFSDPLLNAHVRDHLKPVNEKLGRMRLLRTKEDQKKTWQAFWAAFLAIAALGGTKFFLGLQRGKPVGFLIALLVVSFIALMVILKPTRGTRPTKLGRRYLKSLRKHFNWLKDSITQGQTGEGMHLDMGIAVFGTGMLAGLPFYSSFIEAFPLHTASQSFGIRDDGGGADSGGGCGDGGGCGGGGCGGCGGD